MRRPLAAAVAVIAVAMFALDTGASDYPPNDPTTTTDPATTVPPTGPTLPATQ